MNLEKRLQEIRARKAEIRKKLEADGPVDLDKFESELRELNTEEADIQRRLAMMATTGTDDPEARRVANPTAQPDDDDTDLDVVTRSTAYRRAFMRFMQTGQRIEGFEGVQVRADAYTGVSDLGAVIPSTIIDEIIREMKTYGQLFSRVRTYSIRGGVSVPILTLKPVATWINDTNKKVSDRQKVSATDSVTFSYHGLECRVAVSIIADAVSLASFEATIASIIVEAMIGELERSIIKGTGSGQMLGITVDPRVTAGQKVELNNIEVGDWASWKRKVFAKIPLSYRAGGNLITAAGTFEGYIDGMVDEVGQPVGRVNQGITDGPQERFNGRGVILVEDDVVAPFDAANEGDVIAVFCKLDDYAINSNMQFSMFRYFDHEANEWVNKAILIADGKLLDPHGVIVVTKGADVPTP